jgi:hypothetical protein
VFRGTGCLVAIISARRNIYQQLDLTRILGTFKIYVSRPERRAMVMIYSEWLTRRPNLWVGVALKWMSRSLNLTIDWALRSLCALVVLY